LEWLLGAQWPASVPTLLRLERVLGQAWRFSMTDPLFWPAYGTAVTGSQPDPRTRFSPFSYFPYFGQMFWYRWLISAANAARLRQTIQVRPVIGCDDYPHGALTLAA
jgi:hypothetical protein